MEHDQPLLPRLFGEQPDNAGVAVDGDAAHPSAMVGGVPGSADMAGVARTASRASETGADAGAVGHVTPQTTPALEMVTTRQLETIVPSAQPLRIGRHVEVMVDPATEGKVSVERFIPAILGCGHIAKTLADVGGVSTLSGVAVCPQCLVRCPVCSRAIAVHETVEIAPDVRFCLVCAEAHRRSMRWQWLKALLLAPFVRRTEPCSRPVPHPSKTSGRRNLREPPHQDR